MARKNTLFEVDIKKENPLKTILNNGKIPVLQYTDHFPFYNYNIYKWYKYELEEKDKDIASLKEHIHEMEKHGLENFTYFNIGGFHGRSFSHYHCGNMNIHIGYIEPDEIIYDKTSETYITAKRKFESVQNAWKSLLKKEKEVDIIYGKWSYFNEHFADFQSVYGDSKHIKKVMTIIVDDYIDLLPYVDDGCLSLNCISDIYDCADLTPEFLEHIDSLDFYETLDEYIERECAEACPPIMYKTIHDFCAHDMQFERMLLEEFYSYYTDGKFVYDVSFWKEYKVKFNEFMDFLDSYIPKNKDVFLRKSYTLYASISHLRIEFDNHCFYFNDEGLRVFKLYDYDSDIEEILSDEVRYEAYEFVTILDKYFEILKDYTTLEYPDYFHEFKKFYELEMLLRFNGYNYMFKNEDKCIEIRITPSVIVTYNYQLKDFVIQAEDNYYNDDKMGSFKGRRDVEFLIGIIKECMR